MRPSRDPLAPPAFRLLTLGGVSLVDATGTAAVDQRRRLALLVLLASARERGLSRDKLVSCLSPESTTESARHSLHQLLYYLRQQLGESAFIGPDPLRLNPLVVAADVADFESALDDNRFADGVALYRGPFLDGFHLDSAEFEAWVDAERLRLAGRYGEALVHLAAESEARADHAAAIGWWRKLVTLDPLSGRYAFGLMQSLANAGDTPGALRHAATHQACVRAELGTTTDRRVSELATSLTHGSNGSPRAATDVYTTYLVAVQRAERATAPEVLQAISELERAIVADPAFAPSYAALAYALSIAIDYAIVPADEACRRAMPAIDHALALDPKLGLARLARARILQLRDWNWKAAEAEYRIAIEVEPSARAYMMYGWFLEWYVGRADEGVAMGERAVQFDPISALMHSALAWRLRGADRLDDAIEEAHTALALDPKAIDAYWILAESYLRRSDFVQAERFATQYVRAAGDDVPANSTTLGEIYARTGRVTEARAHAARLALRAPRDGPSLVALARTEMALGDRGRALSLLEQAVKQRIFTIPFQPYWEPIRDDPRFHAIVRAQGL